SRQCGPRRSGPWIARLERAPTPRRARPSFSSLLSGLGRLVGTSRCEVSLPRGQVGASMGPAAFHRSRPCGRRLLPPAKLDDLELGFFAPLAVEALERECRIAFPIQPPQLLPLP